MIQYYHKKCIFNRIQKTEYIIKVNLKNTTGKVKNFMGLFGLSRKDKEDWTSIIIQGLKPGMQIDDVLLKNVTETYITQHIRILEDSVRIVMESKNQKTREERYDLSLQQFDALSKIQKYADKAQKNRIADAQNHFMIMNEYYKHPDCIRKQEKQERKKQK